MSSPVQSYPRGVALIGDRPRRREVGESYLARALTVLCPAAPRVEQF